MVWIFLNLLRLVLWLKILLILVNVLGTLGKKCILLLLGRVFYKCQLGCLITLFVFHILTIFFCVLSFVERGVEISDYICEFIYFSFHLSEFLLYVFLNLFYWLNKYLGLICIPDKLTAFLLWNYPLYLLPETNFDIDIATSILFD